MTNHLIQPDNIEKWSYEKYVGVISKLLADEVTMTVLRSRLEPGTAAFEHIHPHEQIGICLTGEKNIVIDSAAYKVRAGEFNYFPGDVPHPVLNHGTEPAVLRDFFSPKREDLLKRRLKQNIEHRIGGTYFMNSQEEIWHRTLIILDEVKFPSTRKCQGYNSHKKAKSNFHYI